jgi:hypothetical protein
MPPVNQPITLIATVIFSVLVLAGLHAIYGLAVWLLFVLIGLLIGIYVAALRFLRKKYPISMEWRDPDSNRGHHDFQSVSSNRHEPPLTAMCRFERYFLPPSRR